MIPTFEPPSAEQTRAWLLHQISGESPAHHRRLALRWSGTLDLPTLERALGALARRHDALRTTLTRVGGQLTLAVHGEAEAALDVESVEALPAPQREAAAFRRSAQHAARPFDLESAPPWRALLVREEAGSGLLCLVAHDVICDGERSLELLSRDLFAVYDALLSRRALPPPPSLRPRDLVARQAGERERDWPSDLDYFRASLERAPTSLELPFDRPRPRVLPHAAERSTVHFSPEQARALDALVAREKQSPHALLLGCLGLVLHHHSGADDLVIGTTLPPPPPFDTQVAGRLDNPVAVRLRLPANGTLGALLAGAAEAVSSAVAHGALPFERVLDALDVPRHLEHAPLFQVTAELRRVPAPISAAKLCARVVPLPQPSTPFDAVFHFLRPDGGLACEVFGKHAVFDIDTVERMARHVGIVLERAAAAPAQTLAETSLLTPLERREVLELWNDTSAPHPEACVHALFEAQVARDPEAIALTFEGRSLSYRALSTRANQLARALQKRGVGPDAIVGLCVERSLSMVVGMLGVMKAGGAYLPLDPAYPADRLAFMVEDSGLSVLLTQRAVADRLPPNRATILHLDAEDAGLHDEDPSAPEAGVGPGNLAYVIYTSGSTGRPKGVLVEHRGVGNLAAVQRKHFGATPGSRVLQFASMSFDASLFEVVMALLNGATLCLGKADALMPGPPLSSFLRENAVSIAVLPPTALAYMDPGDFPALKTLLVAGEACPPELVKRWATGRRFVNAYGPTETTVMATFAVCKADVGKPPIGRPLANFEAYVLNEAQQPVPIGAPGELYIGGVGLARGYLGRPELTASRFVPSPFREGARLYRTGDRVRYLPDATLDFLGRVDDQVKLRGFRIELGEIEAVIATHAAVREAAVIVAGEGGDRRLVAFVVLAPGQEATSEALREHVKARLPPHMVPGAVEALAALPLTPNAKVDRKALGSLVQGASPKHALVEPRTPTERVVAAVWAEVLRRERVGALDDFFALGGHSLSAVRAAMKLEERFLVAVPLRLLFEKPTVAALAEDIAARRGEATAARAEIGRSEGRESWPLTFGQEQVWFVDNLQPGTHAYDHPSIHRLIGPIDEELLEACLAAVVARHGALRTTFAQIGGVPAQIVADAMEVPIERIDLRGLASEARRAEALSVAREAARRSFDLTRGPLIAATLLRVSEDERLLILNLHHIVSDAWSMALLHAELGALYGARLRGEAPALPALPIQYADFAVFQREEAASLHVEEQLAWWRHALDGAPLHLDLPADKRRPAAASFRGATARLTLDAALAEQLRALGRRLGVTPFVVLLAGFALVLHRHARQDDLLVGVPTSGRARKECEHLIGMFTNVLVLRSKLAESRTFAELARALGSALLAAHEHGDVPFERVVEALHPSRDLAENPVVQVAIVPQDIPFEGLSLDGARVEALELDRDVAQFDLIVFTRDGGAEIAVWAEYATDLFLPATAAALLARWSLILAQAARDEGRSLDDLALCSPSDEAFLASFGAVAEAPRPGAPFDLGRGERVAQLFSAGSPEAELSLRASALAGATLVPISPADARSERLAAALRVARVSSLLAPPALVREAARRAPAAFAGLRQLVLAGGEPLDGDTTLAILEAGPPARFCHLHALAESPVVMVHEISGAELGRAAPIGRPLAGVLARVLDERRRLAPPGMPGELFVGGALLPPLDPSAPQSAEIAVDLGPRRAARLRPTGAVARLRWDGEIELAGRSSITPDTELDDAPAPGSPDDAALRPVLQVVLRIFREVLATPEIAPGDDFFERGGHSLKAVQILARVERELGVRAGLRQFFQRPNAESLAAFVESTGAAPPSQPRRSLSPNARADQLSFPQRDLLDFDAQHPGAAYHIPLALRLSGPLAEGALREALARVARRHEPLRTSFTRGPDGPSARVDEAAALDLALDDLRALPEDARLDEARRRATALLRRPFDLGAPPLARAALYRLAEDDHLLALSLHHLVADGWSVGVVLREIEQLYPALARGAAPSLPPLPARYADFAASQAHFLDAGASAEGLAFWRTTLADAPHDIALPGARPPPPARTHAGDSEALLLDAATNEALKAIGNRLGVTPFMVRLTLFAAVLAELSDQRDLVIGSASSGRVDHDHEGLVGCFFNKVALRLRLDEGLSFGASVERVREATLRAFEHDLLPFPLVAAAVDPDARGRHPVFQVAYAAQEASWDELSLPGLRCEPVFLDRGMAPLDLTLYTREVLDGLRVWLEYDTARFDVATIRGLLAAFEARARAMIV